MSAHESLDRHAAPAELSPRAFALVMTLLFTAVAVAPLLHHRPLRHWGFYAAAAFLLAGMLAPALLRPATAAWTRLGIALGKITNPIVIGLAYALVITPAALLLRALGKDPLARRLEPARPTYWLARVPPGPMPEGLRDQF